MANWSYGISLKHDRATFVYHCIDGFTRTRPNVDRIKCVNNNGTSEWRGQFEDCQLNYCPLDDLYDNVLKASAQIISYGNPPNGTFLDELADRIRFNQKVVGIFYANAELLYNCIDGYTFGDSLQFKRTCKMNPKEIGFGRWEPTTQPCTRMPT